MKIIFAIVVLVYSAGAVAIPGDISFAHVIQYETRFQQLISSPDPQSELKSLIDDDLLVSLYQTESYVMDFENELDQLVDQAKKNPDFHADPLAGETYQKIQTMRHVSQALADELKYIYQRLLTTIQNSTERPENIEKAKASLEMIRNYFGNLPEEDHRQFADLISDINNISGVPSDSESAKYKETALHADLTEKASKRKAIQARTRRSPRIDREIREENQSSEPHPPMNYLAPSSGPSGNVTGAEFPEGVWALTFDDGPDPHYSIPLMDALGAHRDKVNTKGAPASFFWLAKNVASYKDVVREGVERGFSLNCHSWTHANLARVNEQRRNHEIRDAVDFERRAYGRDFHFYRCPGGSCINPKVAQARQMIADLGLIHAYWNVDSLDWKLRSAQRTFNMVTKQMMIQKRGILLMHDIHPFSLAAAKMVLNWIKEQNDSGNAHIELYTLDDAVDMHNKAIPPAVVGKTDKTDK